MWIIRTIECWLHGHSYIDVTTETRPYRYCLHCGKIEEPAAVLKRNHLYPIKSQPGVN
jgi:hypothetical protein